MRADDLLAALYHDAAGNPANLVRVFEVGRELGLPTATVKLLVQDLMARGLIQYRLTRGRVLLTPAGCKQVESAISATMPAPANLEIPGTPLTSLFVSYSHRDSDWLEKVLVHLEPLIAEGLVLWVDRRRMQPGDTWLPEIEKGIKSATAALLLVSQNYLASEFIRTAELPRLLEVAEARGMRIIPLVLSHSTFGASPLAGIQPWNTSNNPLKGMGPNARDKALADLALWLLAWMRVGRP